MSDDKEAIEQYQERLWRYQVKELSRNYQRLVIVAIKTGITVGITVGAVTALGLTILLRR